jgi:hypothetical protein
MCTLQPFAYHICILAIVLPILVCEYSHCCFVPIPFGIGVVRLGIFESFTISVSFKIFFLFEILVQAQTQAV